MTDTAGLPGDRIRSFIERVERIDEEIKALNEGKKEVFAEAKGEGFDVRVLREICACASRTRTSATNRSRRLTCSSGPWRALARRKQRRRSAEPATNFWLLQESCSHGALINLRRMRRAGERAEPKPSRRTSARPRWTRPIWRP